MRIISPWLLRVNNLEIPPVPQNGNISDPASYWVQHVILRPKVPTKKDFNIGGDAKIGLGPSLNLDLTINPDFSQVEVDPSQFFGSSKYFSWEASVLRKRWLIRQFWETNRIRPFFTADRNRSGWSHGLEKCSQSIYGGARLSGKLNENLRIGLYPCRLQHDVGIKLPSTNYSVLALQQKNTARSNIG